MTIYKYNFEVTNEVTISMPEGAHILTVQVQYGVLCLWAIVDPKRPYEPRKFRIFGTGHDIDIDIARARYIGTFQLSEGAFIGHLFEPNAVKV